LDRNPRVHLLRDLLKPDFPEARIFSFAYNSDWLIKAPVKTAQQIASRLLDQLKAARSNDLVRFSPRIDLANTTTRVYPSSSSDIASAA
jgi:hypothetical protein